MLTPFVPALLVVAFDLAVLGPFDVLLEDRVEADDAAVERLVELEVLLLRALHVHNVDRVVVRLHMFVSLVLVV